MTNLIKLSNVSDSATVIRCSNGWMVEVSGWNSIGLWSTTKYICASDLELHTLLDEYKQLPLTN